MCISKILSILANFKTKINMSGTATTANSGQGHPKGLYVLFVTEMWERFSYYGMRALFVLFMVKALLFEKAQASEIYGSYTGLVYLTPLIGGYMADRYWGNRKSIIIGGFLMALGQFFMFLAGSFYEQSMAPMIMYGGLAFLILGNGFFKPNISTMVGQLYPEGDKRVESAFTIFYMGINLGAFIAPLLCGYLGDTGNPEDFRWGFLAACLGMILSLILFIALKNKYIVTPDGVQIGDKPNNVRKEDEVKVPLNPKRLIFWLGVFGALFFGFYQMGMDVIGAFIFGSAIAAPGFIITDSSLVKEERDRLWVIYIVAFFVIFFWAAFEQAGASLTFFAEEQTDRNLFGSVIPASYFQSINALAIVIFAPIFVWIWGALGKRNREPASPFKQSLGLFLLALGYLVIAIGVKGINPSTKVSMMWLVSVYTIHTLGELCLSPIGLSMVNKLSPVRFASLLMGVWFLSTAAANKFAGTLSEYYPEDIVMESSYIGEADAGVFEKLATNTIDSNFVNDAPDDQYMLPVAKITTVKVGEGETQKDSITSIDFDKLAVVDAEKANESSVEVFKLKLIKAKKKSMNSPLDSYFENAVLLENGMLLTSEKVQKKNAEGKLIDKDVLQVWNLSPEKPKFAGFPIVDLYDFFMIFVILAGVASIILFFLSKKLIKMMHGVR